MKKEVEINDLICPFCGKEFNIIIDYNTKDKIVECDFCNKQFTVKFDENFDEEYIVK